MVERYRTVRKSGNSGLISRRSLLLSAPFALTTGVCLAQPAQRRTVGIIYAPSDRFAPIIDATFAGIEAATPQWTIERRLLRPGVTAAEISDWLKEPVSGWLLLGTEASTAVRDRRMDRPAVIGLQYVSSEENAAAGGVSLDFDPEAVFPELKSLLPRHNRIHAINIRGRDDWIIERLRRAGAMRGFSVLPAAANNLSEATDHFSGILRYGNPATDIIWILGGPDLVTRDTSAHLFQRAYNARFPVFSNRRAWVEEGAFLGGEPDFREHGTQLARVLSKVLETGAPHFEMTSKISFALNVRVARRIGVSVTEDVRRRMGALVADD